MPTNPSHSSAFSIVARSLAADAPGREQQRRDPLADLVLHAEGDVLAAREALEQAHVLERAHHAAAGDLVGRRARPAPVPLSLTEPRSGRMNPVRRLNTVVLPAPFGPDQGHDGALAQREREVVGGDDAAEALGQPGDLEHHRRAVPDSAARAVAVTVAPWLGLEVVVLQVLVLGLDERLTAGVDRRRPALGPQHLDAGSSASPLPAATSAIEREALGEDASGPQRDEQHEERRRR